MHSFIRIVILALFGLAPITALQAQGTSPAAEEQHDFQTNRRLPRLHCEGRPRQSQGVARVAEGAGSGPSRSQGNPPPSPGWRLMGFRRDRAYRHQGHRRNGRNTHDAESTDADRMARRHVRRRAVVVGICEGDGTRRRCRQDGRLGLRCFRLSRRAWSSRRAGKDADRTADPATRRPATSCSRIWKARRGISLASRATIPGRNSPRTKRTASRRPTRTRAAGLSCANTSPCITIP